MPPPITILHVINGLYTGGAERMLVKLLGKMDRQRFTNSVVSLLAGGELAGPLRAPGIPVTELGISPGGRGGLDGLRRLSGIIKSERPMIVQGWMYHGNLAALLAGWRSSHGKIMWNIRCSDMRDGHGSLTARLIKIVTAKLARFPAVVIVNAEAGKSYHEKIGYRPRRWKIIPNGFAVEIFRPDAEAGTALRNKLGLGKETVLVGLIARFNPMKDHANFIAAAGLVAGEISHARFIMGGLDVTPDNPALMRLIQDAGHADKFHLLGQCEAVEKILPGLDILVQASSYGEGFPNILGEAMACGVPCVATDVGDTRLIIGETGKIVAPRDESALARAIRELLILDDEARRQLGDRARRRIMENYALDTIVHRYEDIYAEIGDDPTTATRAVRQHAI